jgi:Neprosin
MGSGEFASAGYLKAAYQRAVFFVPFSGVPTTALLTAFDTPGFYTTQLTNNSGDPNWGTFFFFGGPGHP